MKKLGKELEFISFIKRDGSGTIPIGTEWTKDSNHPKTDDVSYMDNEKFDLSVLSLSKETFIASGFNTFVVKIKESKESEIFDKAVEYVKDKYCEKDSVGIPFLLIGDVAELIEITTGKKIDKNKLTICEQNT